MYIETLGLEDYPRLVMIDLVDKEKFQDQADKVNTQCHMIDILQNENVGAGEPDVVCASKLEDALTNVSQIYLCCSEDLICIKFPPKNDRF